MRSTRHTLLTLLAAALIPLAAFAPLTTSAQEPPSAPNADVPQATAPERPEAPEEVDAASERAAQFRAVSGGTTEDVPGGPLVLAAYFGILLLLFLFLLRQGRLITAAHRELNALREEALNRSE